MNNAGTTEGYSIDTGVRMPEPAHVARNRAAGALLAGRAVGTRHRFDESNYRATRGKLVHRPHAISDADARRIRANEPMPLWLKRMRLPSVMPNSTAPTADLKAFHAIWHDEQRETRRSQRQA